MSASEKRRVSVINWLGTLILYAIPGVNLIALILMASLSKAQAKRAFAIAGILLMIVTALLIVSAFLFFPEQLLRFAEWLRQKLRFRRLEQTCVSHGQIRRKVVFRRIFVLAPENAGRQMPGTAI